MKLHQFREWAGYLKLAILYASLVNPTDVPRGWKGEHFKTSAESWQVITETIALIVPFTIPLKRSDEYRVILSSCGEKQDW